MEIRIDILQLIQKLLVDVPLHTPYRVQFIAEEIFEYMDKFNENYNYVLLDLNLPDSEKRFLPTNAHVQFLINNLQRSYLSTNRYDTVKKILIPSDVYCCERRLRIDSRPANVRLYDINTVYLCFYYHSRCSNCKTVYYYNYSENKENVRKYRNPKDLDFFVTASGVGFATKLLNRVSLDVSIGNTSFSKISKIYNEMVFTKDDIKLNSGILEDNWLLYRLLMIYDTVFWDRKKENRNYFTEQICKKLYPYLKEYVDSMWLSHRCNEIGCKNRFTVIDGNEKLYRYCCSAPIQKFSGNIGEINTVVRCINNPKRGNEKTNHNSLCSIHSININSDENVEEIDLRPITRSYKMQLQNVIISGNGCKLLENINKYHNRTAGMFYLFRPCGIRLSHAEMYTAESLSGVFTKLVDTFTDNPSSSDIRGIVYDRACDLKPYLKRLSFEGNDVASKYIKLAFIVDIWHAEKHTQPKCCINNDNCEFHPDLPHYGYVRKMNMEVAEQSFHLINPIKHIARNMCYAKRLCLLKIIDHDYNLRLSKSLK